MDIRNRRKAFANASDYLETWDDSDNITAVNAQKFGDILQKWWHSHSEAQYHQLTYRSSRDWTEA